MSWGQAPFPLLCIGLVGRRMKRVIRVTDGHPQLPLAWVEEGRSILSSHMARVPHWSNQQAILSNTLLALGPWPQMPRSVLFVPDHA